jgi:hypothetical protein
MDKMILVTERISRSIKGILWTLVCGPAFLVQAPLPAAELTQFGLEAERDGYWLRTQGLIDAPKDAIWRVLTDYGALYRISPRIIESELVAVDANGTARVRTLNRICFLKFCRELRHVQIIRERGYGEFESESVAAESDLARGYARWRLNAEGAATRLDIDFQFAMDSYAWVPGFVTRFVARSALRADAEALLDGIEQAASRRKTRVEQAKTEVE